MSDMIAETAGCPKFDPEAFAMNLAKAMESAGQALAAYLKPRENGEARTSRRANSPRWSRPSPAVAEYWLSDQKRAADLQTKLGKSYLDLWGQAARRLAGEEAEARHRAVAARQALRDPEWKSNQFFDFVLQAYLLTTQWAQELVRNADGLDPHTRKKAEFYVQQITNALAPSNFVLTNPEVLRETLASNGDNLVRGMKMLAEDIEAGRGTLRIRQSDPANLEVGVNMATTPGKVIFQNELMQLIQYHADHGNRAAHAAADRAAVDQQVLHPRSQAGKILHQMVRRSGHHRVRDLLGQSGQGARRQDLRRLHEARPADRDGRHRKGHRRDEGPHRSAIASAAPCSPRRWPGSPKSAGVRVTSATFFDHAGRLHPCRRPAGVRRRGPDLGAGARHAGRRRARRQQDGDGLQHAALRTT